MLRCKRSILSVDSEYLTEFISLLPQDTFYCLLFYTSLASSPSHSLTGLIASCTVCSFLSAVAMAWCGLQSSQTQEHLLLRFKQLFFHYTAVLGETDLSHLLLFFLIRELYQVLMYTWGTKKQLLLRVTSQRVIKLAEFPCQVSTKLLTFDLRHTLLNVELYEHIHSIK